MARIINKICSNCGKKYITTDSYQHRICSECVGKEKKEMISNRLQELRENKTLEERIDFLEREFCMSEYHKKYSRHNISTRII